MIVWPFWRASHRSLDAFGRTDIATQASPASVLSYVLQVLVVRHAVKEQNWAGGFRYDLRELEIVETHELSRRWSRFLGR
jgi:hypothetical protein